MASATATVLLAGLTTTGAQAVEASPEPVLSEGQRALADARKAGERVEVRGQRSERTTVFANPDGYTFTLEEASVPVRVAKPGADGRAPTPNWSGARTAASARRPRLCRCRSPPAGATSPWCP
ncbi:hypothetical protein Smic_58400 [Streptomyces microflavus]|uniref:Uncharacterized protein n=1 Tax=Streptomyces microflavus TaxID=1919 RepID=A0A7J0CZE0_STRMI|nr:hypothetical protein Smic_58400 [Streptomyces microflavus]